MKPVLIIGDVHGHLDRLEALLKQEGLLDRCDHCDGSGMIYEPAPDDFAHEYEMGTEIDCGNCNGDGWARTNKDALVVQLGDLGHFGEGGSPTGDTLCYKYAYEGWVDIILWGNHDRYLADNGHASKGSRRNREVEHYIKRLYQEGRMQLALEAGGFLITHAGLAMAFKNQKVPDELKTDIVKFVDWINDEDDKWLETGICDKQAIGIRDAVGNRRGGSGSIGGILWRDIEERLYHWPQIFGHSADHKRHMVQYCWNSNHTRSREKFDEFSWPEKEISYCIDIGGKGDRPGDNCLAGIWLPDERIVRVDL